MRSLISAHTTIVNDNIKLNQRCNVFETRLDAIEGGQRTIKSSCIEDDDELIELIKGSKMMVDKKQLEKAKKQKEPKKFVNKIFSSVVKVEDIYR